ncbi:MAG: Hsp70 family protein [Planctomycetota bacterium]
MAANRDPTASALDKAFSQQRSRFVVGIDLGTTNCAIAYADTQNVPYRVRPMRIEQLIEFGTLGPLDTLPSFHYELTANEAASVDPRFQFDKDPQPAKHPGIVGALARERSMQVPGRGIASAKSWLCNPQVDRRSDLLPWHGDEDVERLSPVEASRRYLEHLRRLWDRDHPSDPLSDQEVVVTLPASFDEVARQLTLEAAIRAGIPKVTLIEEPQAAFYAWLERHQERWTELLQAGQTILVCDIGGGTTDFTLIRVIDSAIAHDESDDVSSSLARDLSQSAESRLEKTFGLHRVAVGPHLLLGGDNLDLALAHYVEQQLAQGEESKPLTPRQWDMLKAQARSAKELILGSAPPPNVVIALPGSGSRLIASTRSVTIEREWARQLLLDGFFGSVALDARPLRGEGLFQEFGLPYESEPSVHKHLAQFLWEHRWAGRADSDRERLSETLAARPDWILFNGGVLESTEIRNALVEQVRAWFASESPADWRPGLLEGNRLDLAVALGAAYFGLVRRGEGIRIDARLARTIYLQVQQSPPQAICIMPSSAAPLDTLRLDQHPFELRVGEPVQFPLFCSSTQLTHRFGELVDVDLQAMTPMPPIQTVLDWGRGRRRESIPVVLETELTEIGTLAMRVVTQSDFAAREGEARWNLEFDVRGSAPQQDGGPLTDGIGEIGEIVDESQIARCTQALDTVFGEQPSGSPSQAYGLISDAIGLSRKQWPVSLLRSLWGYLLEHADCRKRSPDAEARWLNLVGWCLRPGFGYPADDWRVQQTWRSVHNKLMHRSSSGVSESIILWRRISGGFTAGQQNALYQDCWSRVKPMLIGGGTQASTNVLAELLRLLGSLERLRSADKSAVAEACLQALETKKMDPLRPALLWTIGRLGCRVPVYASLQQTVSIERAMAWIDALLSIDAPWVGKESSAYCLALMLLARKTGDRYRDVSEKVRGRVVERMNGLGAPAMHLDLVERGGRLDDEQTAQVVGDSLPLGFALRT